MNNYVQNFNVLENLLHSFMHDMLPSEENEIFPTDQYLAFYSQDNGRFMVQIDTENKKDMILTHISISDVFSSSTEGFNYTFPVSVVENFLMHYCRLATNLPHKALAYRDLHNYKPVILKKESFLKIYHNFSQALIHSGLPGISEIANAFVLKTNLEDSLKTHDKKDYKKIKL